MLIKHKQDRHSLEQKCISKWIHIFNNKPHIWKDIILRPFTVYRSTQLKSIQFRLLHGIITFNHWLFNEGIKNTPNCETCNVDDTLIHFFIDCVHVQNFWANFKTWWANITLLPGINLSNQDLLLGVNTLDQHFLTLNQIITLANKFIHDSKWLQEKTFLYSLSCNT